MANATTWGKSEVDDPILKGEKCQVSQPMSSGSYIYQWPSKYDLVFWPFTVQSGIWFCEKSGFVAFINDFKKLKTNEIEAISDYLKKNDSAITDFSSMLLRMEKLYSLRESTATFNNRLLRNLAYLFETENKISLANQYRRKALTMIEKSLNGELAEQQKLEYLFLATVYNKQFGDSNKYALYLNELTTNLDLSKDKELEGFVGYLKALVKDVSKVELGGVLAPSFEPKLD